MKKLLLIFLLINLLKAGIIEDNYSNELKTNTFKIFDENFDEALAFFDYLCFQFPEEPVGFFGKASLFSAMGDHYESKTYRDSAQSYYKLVIDKSDLILQNIKDANDPWIYFYKGASLSNEGFYNGKNGSFFSALSNILEGMDYIEKSLELDENFLPSKFILGGYIYYKSKITSWIYDRRSDGIEMIKDTAYKENISQYFALAALIWIYIDEEKFSKAIELSDIGLIQFQDSRYFMWGKAKALICDEKFDQAEIVYKKILDQVKNDKIESPLNETMCFMRLSKIYYELGNNKLSIDYFGKINLKRLSEDQLDKIDDEYKSLEKKISAKK
ncbi:MAG: hypothetical protein JXR48_03760 [Candidatus Delongbacteria bacterium]|nr:hypothetical protein [Candidatus Delongbacteria bacterium]MBN2834062.1 hypothetical protein [Candidatus Delongbacteria bacterium]